MSAEAYASLPRIESEAILDKGSNPEPQIDGGNTAVSGFIRIQGSAERFDKINLGTLFDGRFRVRKPIPVTLDRSGEGVAAIWPEIDEFGFAESASAASVELARTLVELYSTLEREQSNLGTDLDRVWGVLKQHIEPIRREC
jgi:hypothetical protein